MAKCAICEKGVHFGHNVSHSHRKSNRIWKSNIKRVHCKVNGVPPTTITMTSIPSANQNKVYPQIRFTISPKKNIYYY